MLRLMPFLSLLLLAGCATTGSGLEEQSVRFTLDDSGDVESVDVYALRVKHRVVATVAAGSHGQQETDYTKQGDDWLVEMGSASATESDVTELLEALTALLEHLHPALKLMLDLQPTDPPP